MYVGERGIFGFFVSFRSLALNVRRQTLHIWSSGYKDERGRQHRDGGGRLARRGEVSDAVDARCERARVETSAPAGDVEEAPGAV